MDLRSRFSLQGNAFALLLAAAFLALLASCGTSQQPPAEKSSASEAISAGSADSLKRYQLRGKIVRLDADNQAAVIQHEEIVGWMDAMTMRFPVKEKSDWEKLAVGKQITATLFVGDDGFHIGEIELVGEGEAGTPKQ